MIFSCVSVSLSSLIAPSLVFPLPAFPFLTRNDLPRDILHTLRLGWLPLFLRVRLSLHWAYQVVMTCCVMRLLRKKTPSSVTSVPITFLDKWTNFQGQLCALGRPADLLTIIIATVIIRGSIWRHSNNCVFGACFFFSTQMTLILVRMHLFCIRNCHEQVKSKSNGWLLNFFFALTLCKNKVFSFVPKKKYDYRRSSFYISLCPG